jgi:hypothetical protein
MRVFDKKIDYIDPLGEAIIEGHREYGSVLAMHDVCDSDAGEMMSGFAKRITKRDPMEGASGFQFVRKPKDWNTYRNKGKSSLGKWLNAGLEIHDEKYITPGTDEGVRLYGRIANAAMNSFCRTREFYFAGQRLFTPITTVFHNIGAEERRILKYAANESYVNGGKREVICDLIDGLQIKLEAGAVGNRLAITSWNVQDGLIDRMSVTYSFGRGGTVLEKYKVSKSRFGSLQGWDKMKPWFPALEIDFVSDEKATVRLSDPDDKTPEVNDTHTIGVTKKIIEVWRESQVMFGTQTSKILSWIAQDDIFRRMLLGHDDRVDRAFVWPKVEQVEAVATP